MFASQISWYRNHLIKEIVLSLLSNSRALGHKFISRDRESETFTLKSGRYEYSHR